MAKRLLPTGKCWCGCGTDTDLGSFFAPGHDKRAEARLIMEVFGGVPQFLHAFGYAPGSLHSSTSAWIENARRLAALNRSGHARTKLILEYTDLASPRGALRRTKPDVVVESCDLEDGSARFKAGHDPAYMFTVPFVDLAAIYAEPSCWIVRVTGAIEIGDDRMHYVGLATAHVAEHLVVLRLTEGWPASSMAGFLAYPGVVRVDGGELTAAGKFASAILYFRDARLAEATAKAAIETYPTSLVNRA